MIAQQDMFEMVVVSFIYIVGVLATLEPFESEDYFGAIAERINNSSQKSDMTRAYTQP